MRDFEQLIRGAYEAPAGNGMTIRAMSEALAGQRVTLDDVRAVADALARSGFTASEVIEFQSEAIRLARGGR